MTAWTWVLSTFAILISVASFAVNFATHRSMVRQDRKEAQRRAWLIQQEAERQQHWRSR